MKKLIFAAAAVLACAGCKEYKSADGTIPDQYVAQAKVLEGTYAGSFAGHKGSLVVKIDGNRPEVSFVGANGDTDILGDKCNSEIGRLKTVDISNDKTITGATFAFNPVNCISIQGDEVDLSIGHGGSTISAKILSDSRWIQGPCQYGPYGQQYCPPPDYVPTYFYGRFSK